MSNERQPGRRMLVWIDGVGGYMICFGDELLLGQPGGGTRAGDPGGPAPGADVPILADLSRRHASIRRQGESYVLTPIHRVRIAGQALAGPTLLADGTRIELGEAVRLRFRRPHALSATAVLTLESYHKTEPAVDEVLLMSESCLFGSASHSHIQCRQWPGEFVLFRRGDQLHFRSSDSVHLDGGPARTSGVIAGNCRMECESFAMSFEEI